MSAPPELPFGRGPVSRLLTPDRVRAAPGGPFRPFPTADDPEPWRHLDAETRAALRTRAAAAVAADWPRLTATGFADYTRTGSRRPFEGPSFRRRRLLRDLALGATLEITGGARTDTAADTAVDAAADTAVDAAADTAVDAVVDAVWSVCEESSWVVPAHARAVLPDVDDPVVDLFAAETGAQLAWTAYLLGSRLDAVSPVVGRRIVAEIDRRLLTPFERRDWPWMGVDRDHVNNWNPWICSNLIMCTVLTVTDPDRRARLVSRAVAALDVYVHGMLDDGGCTEGQGYWAVAAARLFDALWVLREATGGALDATGLDRVATAVRYPVAMHVEGRRMIQHSDGPGRWLLEPSVLHRYGRAVGYSPACELAIHLRDQPPDGDDQGAAPLWHALTELFEPGYRTADPIGPPALGTCWFPSTQVLTARERPGSTTGLMLAVKGGHNAEDHNQNDVGCFSVVLDGQHVVVDPGVGTYTAQTFSADRYQIWTMTSGWHNLPVVNGVQQAAGRQHGARDVRCEQTSDRDRVVTFSADLAAAWPSEARLRSWRRTVSLDRGAGAVTVSDEWEADELASLELPLVLAVEPVVDAERLSVGGLTTSLAGFSSRVERQPIDPTDRLRPTWGECLWRLVLTPRRLSRVGGWQLRFDRG